MGKLGLKDRILFGSVIVLILLLIFSNCRYNNMQEKMYDQLQESNELIVNMDVTTKEKDGQYTKLVDNFNTQKEMDKKLRKDNKDLYNLLKESNERLLMVNNSVISLRNQVNEGFGEFNSSNDSLIDLKLKYPNDTDWFIGWDGSIHTGTAHYNGEWKFGELPLQIVLTETDRGIWKTRLIGPEWLLVDSIEVNSLKPEELVKTLEQRKFGLTAGGGYIHSFDPNINPAFSVGVGAYFKNHTIILNGMTNNTVGVSYYYRFSKSKKK